MSTAPQIPGLVYIQPLGQGGYADVYLYEQQSPRMPVAVKVLKGEGLTSEVTAEFLAEADTMAALGDHPYIVQVFRAGTAADGRPYLVMKYYPPPNLAARARAERFPVADVLRMGIQLASAVETAHQATIVHRDIKPANVLLSAYGAPGLTDFGIAGRGLHADGADRSADGTGQREEMGVSVPWAAPEVVYGESNGDARSDVYSLAATLWQLLTGRSPFEIPGGDNSAYALMPRIRSKPVPATGRPDVPPALERLLGQGMAKDPGHRPQSAMELARGLQAVEQELRLPRTQILVLDHTGHSSLTRPGLQGQPPARPHPAGGPARPTPGDAQGRSPDHTHVKGPQRVYAQPAPVTPPQHSLGPVAPAPSPASAPPPPGVPSRPGPPPASGRPARAPGSGGPVPGPAPATPGEASADTPLRPSWEGDTQRFVDPSLVDDAQGVTRSGWLRAAVLVGILAVALLAWLLLRGGSPTPPPGPITTIVPTTDSPGIDGVFDPPVVVAESQASSVRFTWSYDAPAPKDVYRVNLGSTPAEALKAPATQVTTRTFDAPAAPGTAVCAIVTVVRSGQLSPPSVAVCATAS